MTFAVVPYYNRGNLYSLIGDYDQALADLGEAIQLSLFSTHIHEIQHIVEKYKNRPKYSIKGEIDKRRPEVEFT